MELDGVRILYKDAQDMQATIDEYMNGGRDQQRQDKGQFVCTEEVSYLFQFTVSPSNEVVYIWTR